MPVTYVKEDTIHDAEAAKSGYKPTHPGLFEVVYAEGNFKSELVASKDFSKDETICTIEGTTPGPKKYTSVQVSKYHHIELNSDRKSISSDENLHYICLLCPLYPDDPLTFFYPSSEWEMDQAFECTCGSAQCIRRIQGAKFLSAEIMSRYFLTSHIRQLLNERDNGNHE
ncbi:hypothetical protein BG004_003060 [Podila humilis]|nr:hypothetical protein BG004_003060 [Podila humilis]